jgi:hypothetical protein
VQAVEKQLTKAQEILRKYFLYGVGVANRKREKILQQE